MPEHFKLLHFCIFYGKSIKKNTHKKKLPIRKKKMGNILTIEMNILEHYELVNIWRKSKCTSSKHVKFDLINGHITHFL